MPTIEQSIANKADLSDALCKLGSLVKEGHDEITLRVVADRAKPNEIFAGNGFTPVGCEISSVLDAKTLPVRGKTTYRWKRSAASCHGSLVWVFWLTKKR